MGLLNILFGQDIEEPATSGVLYRGMVSFNDNNKREMTRFLLDYPKFRFIDMVMVAVYTYINIYRTLKEKNARLGIILPDNSIYTYKITTMGKDVFD